jgi:hypothetical protein
VYKLFKRKWQLDLRVKGANSGVFARRTLGYANACLFCPTRIDYPGGVMAMLLSVEFYQSSMKDTGRHNFLFLSSHPYLPPKHGWNGAFYDRRHRSDEWWGGVSNDRRHEWGDWIRSFDARWICAEPLLCVHPRLVDCRWHGCDGVSNDRWHGWDDWLSAFNHLTVPIDKPLFRRVRPILVVFHAQLQIWSEL